MVELLKKLKLRNTENEYVYLSKWGKKYTSIRNQFNDALENAGITDFKFHDLRHTFSSHFVMNGGDLMSLKEILGHSTLKMVERYAHLSSSHKLKMINNLNYSDNNSRNTPKVMNE